MEWLAPCLLMSAVIAMLARRFQLPSSVSLLVSGFLLARLPLAPQLTLTHDLIFNGLLPPLIYEAALFLPWRELRRNLALVTSMASLGLVLAATTTALGLHLLLDWPLLPAASFAVLIGATDPVSVIASFKEARIGGRLRLLIESESLFNDGTAAVLFGLLASLGQGVMPSAAGIALETARVVAGSIGCGVLVALLLRQLARQSDDPMVALTLSVVVAYGAFMVAEHFALSGVLSTLAAGLVMAGEGAPSGPADGARLALETFWEFAAFVANSLVFLLIGMAEARQDFQGMLLPACGAIVLVLAGRACAIYPLAACFAHTRQRLPWADQHLMVWGGLRGALGLALALSLPAALPLREQIVSLTFAVVAFSVLVQGLSFPPLLRRLQDRVGEEQRP